MNLSWRTKTLTTLPFKCLIYYQREDSLPLLKKWQVEQNVSLSVKWQSAEKAVG